MVELVKKMWWVLAVRGVLGILFGVFAIAWPGATLAGLIVALAIYALVDGVLTLVAAIRRYPAGEPWALSFLDGLLDLAFFALMVVAPAQSTATLWFITAGWAIGSGIVAIVGGVASVYPIGGALVSEVGIASALLGMWMIAWPKAAAFALSWMIGLYAIVSGALFLGLAAQMHRLVQPRLRHSL